MFYNQKYGRINEYGVSEYWVLKEEYIPLQQQISDKYDVITYKPNNRIAQSKNKGENTAISTRPPRRTPIKEATPEVIDTAQHEYEEQLRLEAGGKVQEVITPIDTSIDAQLRKSALIMDQWKKTGMEKNSLIHPFYFYNIEENG